MGSKQIRVDVDEDEHNKLKAKLAAKGSSITKWLRKMVKLELEEK